MLLEKMLGTARRSTHLMGGDMPISDESAAGNFLVYRSYHSNGMLSEVSRVWAALSCCWQRLW
jgi:hypothetical protein